MRFKDRNTNKNIETRQGHTAKDSILKTKSQLQNAQQNLSENVSEEQQSGSIKNIKAEKEAKDMNGNMVSNIKDMKKLGKEMEDIKTNDEILEEGQVPDPVQRSDQVRDKEQKE